MKDTEREILATLNDLDRMVQSMKTVNQKPNLLPVFEKLETLTTHLGRDADASLLHYLHKKSYEKARLYLEARAAENPGGACLH